MIRRNWVVSELAGEREQSFGIGGEMRARLRWGLAGLLSFLRRVAAEVEGVAAFGGEVDFGDEAGLADGVGPGFPAVVAALGGFGENPRHSGDRFQNCLRVFRGDA